ncbi:hypothetical protein [Microbacterium dauci]|uniref:Uncharacterized protein n=1 Tax=Microbacterium dauci TaxID=3048008 RepID=A0ABT6ZCB6_9MICO|nr:hypothetical protein [Microbacterium sp. LX3-4]MDJ1113800.1 hypothetical protein [Microbacterium sp. LX3-4]
MSRRSRKYPIGQEPWYIRDFGGIPGWGLVAVGVVFAGIAVVIVVAIASH